MSEAEINQTVNKVRPTLISLLQLVSGEIAESKLVKLSYGTPLTAELLTSQLGQDATATIEAANLCVVPASLNLLPGTVALPGSLLQQQINTFFKPKEILKSQNKSLRGSCYKAPAIKTPTAQVKSSRQRRRRGAHMKIPNSFKLLKSIKTIFLLVKLQMISGNSSLKKSLML
jgi:hypothetical protein